MNWNIAKNPVNWVKVPLMALVAFFGLFLIFGLFKQED